MADNRLGNSCAEDITTMMGLNGTLHKLSLSDNQFDDRVAYLFADAMEVEKAVRHRSLSLCSSSNVRIATQTARLELFVFTLRIVK
jgi:hypothetical protein